MKRQNLIPVIMIMLCACSSAEENEITEPCKVENLELGCDSADVYNRFLEMEEAINTTFDEESTVISYEDRLQMRRDVTAYYSKNEKILDAVYQSLKKEASTHFDPAEINKMRAEEIALFEKNLLVRDEARAFLEEVEFSQYETDTTMYEYAGEKHYLILKIKNTSDKTVSSLVVSKNMEIDGEMHYQTTPTTYLFMPEQLSPRPADEGSVAVLEPGQTLFLSFETNDEKKAKPEIVGVTFQ